MTKLDDTRKGAWRILLTTYARLVERIDWEMVTAGGVSLEWYDALLSLEEAPEGRLKMGELVDVVLISRSGLTRMVDRIESAGYLQRETSRSYRRAVYAVITESGRVARSKAWEIYEPAIAWHFGRHLSIPEAGTIRDALPLTLVSDQT